MHPDGAPVDPLDDWPTDLFPLPDDWEDYCDEFDDEDEEEYLRAVAWVERPVMTVYLPGDAP